MNGFPFVPMEVVERSQYDGRTYFLIQTASERDGWEVAEVRPDIPWQLKTAQLLSTAPELLEALEACLPCMGWANMSDDDLRDEAEQGNGAAPIILAARAAIAKARGTP